MGSRVPVPAFSERGCVTCVRCGHRGIKGGLPPRGAGLWGELFSSPLCFPRGGGRSAGYWGLGVGHSSCVHQSLPRLSRGKTVPWWFEEPPFGDNFDPWGARRKWGGPVQIGERPKRDNNKILRPRASLSKLCLHHYLCLRNSTPIKGYIQTNLKFVQSVFYVEAKPQNSIFV